MIDIQYGITIMSGREVSRPYRVFSPKASGFYPFGIAKRMFFYVFCFGVPQYLSTEPCQPFLYNRPKEPSLWCVGGNKKASFERRLLVTPEGLEPSTH